MGEILYEVILEHKEGNFYQERNLHSQECDNKFSFPFSLQEEVGLSSSKTRNRFAFMLEIRLL